MTTVTIWIQDLRSVYSYLSDFFSDSTWYSFEKFPNDEFIIFNLHNGKRVHFVQGDSKSRVALISFLARDREEFFAKAQWIEDSIGTVVAEIKELRPDHFSMWAKIPCGWRFGWAYAQVLIDD